MPAPDAPASEPPSAPSLDEPPSTPSSPSRPRTPRPGPTPTLQSLRRVSPTYVAEDEPDTPRVAITPPAVPGPPNESQPPGQESASRPAGPLGGEDEPVTSDGQPWRDDATLGGASDRNLLSEDRPSGLLTPDGAVLLQELAAFERCRKLGEYERCADRVDHHVHALIEAKNPFEAYRALLVYARHAADAQGRPSALREAAIARLRALQGEERLLRYVAGRAMSRSTLTSVQAIQVLRYLGAPAVRVLLEAQAGATTHEQRKLVSILIAMGDEALPTIVDELASPDPARVRRAVAILGDMQNPRGIDFLAGLLSHRDRRVGREAARSLVRIGSQRALDVLIQSLNDGGDRALVAASCLGGSRTRTAMRALIATVPEGSGHSDEVRQEAVRSLGRIGNEAALDCLVDVLRRAPLFHRGRMRSLRCTAAQAIARIGGEPAAQALRSHTRGGDPAVRQACRQALRQVERC